MHPQTHMYVHMHTYKSKAKQKAKSLAATKRSRWPSEAPGMPGPYSGAMSQRWQIQG